MVVTVIDVAKWKYCVDDPAGVLSEFVGYLVTITLGVNIDSDNLHVHTYNKTANPCGTGRF